MGACAIQFLHYAPLYRNTQHYATLNCRIKTRNCGGVTLKNVKLANIRINQINYEIVHNTHKYIVHANRLKFITNEN